MDNLYAKYIAPKGWKPLNPDEDYIITYLKIELSEEAQGKFEEAVAGCCAESSTGTWTQVYDGEGSGVPMADKMRAIAFDLEPEENRFKVAYRVDLFEIDNMSGLLAGIVGNIGGMKMLKALRCLDIRFPRKMVLAFPGPRFGIEGIREQMQLERGPLLLTVPKPKVGRTADEQADLARILFTAADGNYHGIKDDENLTNLFFNKFDERCKKVLAVQKEVEERTGKKKFYLSNVTHSRMDVMLQRANLIKENGGRWMMMDVATTGFAAVHTMRLINPGLAIHAHRAMHSFLTREEGDGADGDGQILDFSMSMVAFAKIMRLLGVDSFHGGAPKTKMENGNAHASIIIRDVLELDETPAVTGTLGQKWYGLKPVWHVASGGLHPGSVPDVLKNLGENIMLQCGGGCLGHPDGIEAGVEAIVKATELTLDGIDVEKWVVDNPNTPLGRAAQFWGFGPKIV
ncbi:ribulose-bisphosphate carboxylase large subunit [bacterium]|nr:ribulose-bisphosphate carboxylase large subunit [bacterium]